ncbi:hypothetical protein Back11_26660 [Paenibacillus baekrokdamisoli]|uniref:Uncharacterized protein n=1 Tax=Paenibacillus baekrokdamisoli TaxID=1712516 RepID=A0A3G9J6D1_9BACL|nr:DUF1572 family protein [Paenibacillus baekrokdamisoli]MBB3070316.1 hypothetical protein [Paenibacillus baekrokdamisoli]BBH21321.1 hypothetical protein Back11_26660 [Paenibacillus baekrokdamisoli]
MLAEHLLTVSIQDFLSMKSLGDKAMKSLPEEGFLWSPEPESNSIAILINHMSGNMISRWTDFLTTDGEKETRNRDSEFELGTINRDEWLQRWEAGWAVLLGTLRGLEPEDMLATVRIRGEAHTVVQAIHRQISHYGYHVGQIVYIAKAYLATQWQPLSIPKGGSASFNANKLNDAPTIKE